MLLLLGVVPMANLVTTGVGLPWFGVAAQQWLVIGGGVLAVVLLAGAAAGSRIETFAARTLQLLLRPGPRSFALCVAVVAAAAALASGWVLFRLQPVAGDEFAQRFHALLLSRGHLAAQVALPREFFSTSETLDVDGRWFSQFPAGWPALLALWVRLGAPWLLAPLCTGVAVVALYIFARATVNEPTARLAALLACACPFLVLMGGTQMNHSATLALLWIAFAALPHWVADASPRRRATMSGLIGGSIGVAATIRPFDAFVCAALIGCFQLLSSRRDAGFWRHVALECAAAIIPVAVLLAVNAKTLGAMLPFAYDVLNGPEHRPGFHTTPLGFDHTPRRGLYMASAYLMKLDVALFAWPLPAILLIAVTMILLRERTAWDDLLAALMLAFLIGYAAYWSESYFLGPRFLFVLAPALVLLTVRFPIELRARMASPALRAAMLLLIPACIIATWLVPADGISQFGIRRMMALYAQRSGASAVVAEVDRQHLVNSVVFIRDGWRERLTARLRAMGMRPLAAEQTILRSDACTLQHALDISDRDPRPNADRVESVTNMVMTDRNAMSVPPQETTARVFLVPGRALDATCSAELQRETTARVTLAELLPFSTLDAHGALGGDVIYARDFGARNEALRRTLGQRRWYLATVDRSGDDYRVSLTPYP